MQTASITKLTSLAKMEILLHTDLESSSNEQSLFQELFKSFRDAFISCQGGHLNVCPKLRFTSGNTTENLRYFETNFGRPWNEIVDRYPPDAPEGDCMVACIMEWGHSQSFDKWSNHPPADYEYVINVSEFPGS